MRTAPFAPSGERGPAPSKAAQRETGHKAVTGASKATRGKEKHRSDLDGVEHVVRNTCCLDHVGRSMISFSSYIGYNSHIYQDLQYVT